MQFTIALPALPILLFYVGLCIIIATVVYHLILLAMSVCDKFTIKTQQEMYELNNRLVTLEILNHQLREEKEIINEARKACFAENLALRSNSKIDNKKLQQLSEYLKEDFDKRKTRVLKHKQPLPSFLTTELDESDIIE